jgi:hypothetical protein
MRRPKQAFWTDEAASLHVLYFCSCEAVDEFNCDVKWYRAPLVLKTVPRYVHQVIHKLTLQTSPVDEFATSRDSEIAMRPIAHL